MFAGKKQISRSRDRGLAERLRASVLCLLVVLTIGSTQLQAQALNLRLDLSLTRLAESVGQAKVLCTLHHAASDASGEAYVVPVDGTFVGFVNVPVTLSRPLPEYQDAQCSVQLCGGQNAGADCGAPVGASQQGTGTAAFRLFDDARSHRLLTGQPLAESLLLLHTPPPSHQMANKSAQNNSQKSSASGKSSKGGMSLADAASAGNDGGAAVETGIALADVVSKANFSSVTGLVVGLVGLAGSKILGASDNASAQILGDVVGIGFTFLGVAAAGTVKAAVTVGTLTSAGASGLILPAVAVGTGAAGLTMKLDKALGGNDKEGRTATLKIVEALFPHDDGDTPEYLAAVERANLREAGLRGGKTVGKTSTTGTAGTGSNSSGAGQGASSGSTTAQQTGDANAASHDSAGSGAGASSSQSGTTATGAGSAQSQVGQSGGGSSPAGQTTNGNTADGTYTVVSREQGADGTTTVTWTLSGHQRADGSSDDGMYHTTYSSDGTYVVTDMWGNKVAEGTGKPSNAAQPGASTTTTTADGSEAVLSGSGETGASGEQGSGEEEEPSGDEDCTNNAADCSNTEEAPPEEEPAETPESETTGDSTPNPDDTKGDTGAGIRWAMQNPDNPLAQQILKDAARAVLANSGYCRLGCAEASDEGGLLWAMLNPGNPLAQSILAAAAQSIGDLSGSGQAGGTGDNPANEAGSIEASELDLQRIELLLAGGGTVDPVDEGGGTPPGDSPIDGGPAIGGGNPVSTNAARVQAVGSLRANSNGDGDGDGDGNDGATVDGSLDTQIDQQSIRSRVTR